MKTKMKTFILLDLLLLAVLFLVSSTDLIVKEKKTEVYKIAVLVDMPAKGQQDNFKAGVMQASIDHNMDTNFINLSAWDNGEEKRAALQKELDNGCRGVILHCENTKQAEEILESVPVGVPVILYDSESASARIRGRVGSDLEEESRLLAEAVLHGRTKGESVTLIEPLSGGWRTETLHQLLQEKLEAAGILVRRVQLEELSGARTLVRGMTSQGGNILVTADISILQALGEAAAENGKPLPIYGTGFHGAVRELLETGAIQGTVVHRAYEAGYLSVEKVIDILNGRGLGQETITVEAAYVTKDTLYKEGIESIVFPYV